MNLTALLEQKRKKLNMQGIGAKATTKEKANWQKCKKYVANLSPDYKQVILSSLKTHTFKQKKTKDQGKIIMNFSTQFEGHEILIEIVEDISGNVKRVIYYAINSIDGKVYRRKIIDY